MSHGPRSCSAACDVRACPGSTSNDGGQPCAATGCVECSGHGSCDSEHGACTCSPPWFGDDCSMYAARTGGLHTSARLTYDGGHFSNRYGCGFLHGNGCGPHGTCMQSYEDTSALEPGVKGPVFRCACDEGCERGHPALSRVGASWCSYHSHRVRVRVRGRFREGSGKVQGASWCSYHSRRVLTDPAGTVP